MPVSDVLAFLIAVFWLRREYHKHAQKGYLDKIVAVNTKIMNDPK